MPNVYVRKGNAAPRGVWTSNDLKCAINAVLSKEMGVNEAAKNFNIPKSTLKRRLKNNQLEKTGRLGPDSALGAAAEAKLASHIKKLQASGFAPTREEVRLMAFNLAVRLGKVTRFKEEKALEGISPVPIVNSAVNKVKRKIMGVITNSDYINHRKQLEIKKSKKNDGTKTSRGRGKRVRRESSSSDSDEILLNDSSSGEEHFSDIENECVGCKEDYRVTNKKEDWLKCVACSRWLHEGCTSFVNLCQTCGNTVARKRRE